MPAVNKAIILGNLGRDPEVRQMNNGDRVCNFPVATSETWKDKQTGERRERTEWHRVVIFNQGLITVVENYLRKGSKVYIEGQLQTRRWEDQSGQDRYTTEIVLKPYRSELVLCNSGGGGQPNYEQHQQGSSSQSSAGGGGPAPPPGPSSLDDDEIPFAPVRELP